VTRLAGSLLLGILLVLVAAPVGAQPRPPRPPRLEVSVGGLLAGGYDLTDVNATLTRNQPGGGRFTLFESETRMDGGPGLEARVGWRFTRAITVEGGMMMLRRGLSSRLTGDVEGARDLTADERLSTYLIDGAVLARLQGLTFAAGRGQPFLRAGLGYLRELHEGNTLVETGLAYHVGGGMTLWFGNRQRVALRTDGRLYVLDGGADLGTGTRLAPAGGAALVFIF
jgi:hypothetical protein